MGGKMIARVDEDIAPTSEIKRPMLGIAAARITERQKEQEKKIVNYRSDKEMSQLHTLLGVYQYQLIGHGNLFSSVQLGFI